VSRGAALALALALAAAVPAGPAAAHQDRLAGAPRPEGRLGPAEEDLLAALARWDLDAAAAAAERLPEPDAPVGRLLRSHLAFHGGDYAGAVRLLEGLPPQVAAAPGFAEAARIARATLELARRLEPVESEHFVLWHDPRRDGVLVEPALEALERGRAAAGAWLGDFPAGKVRVEIVPSAEDFERTSSLAPAEIETAGAVGICKFNKIMILSPRLLLRGYRWRDTLNHEYLHYLQVRLSGNRSPIWLQEGVARYGEALWRGAGGSFLTDVDRSLLARALREDALVPFSAMDPSLVRLPSAGAVRLAFAECALAVERILAGWGEAGLHRLLAELARPGTRGVDDALAAALGLSLDGVERLVREELAGRGFREIPGAVAPALRLAGAEDGETWDLAQWQGEGARNHLRLGDLLRERGKLRAALLEYRRALELAPASPYASLKVARVELELGRPEPAATAAREAVRLWGDYPAARQVLARALAALGRTEEAAGQLEAALEVNPFDPYAWRDLAAALRELGRGEEARRAQRASLRLARGDAELLRMMSNEGPGDRGRGE